MTTKTIVIAGATRGLGAGLIRRFAADGHRVYGCGTNIQKAVDFARETGARMSKVDLTDAAATQSWANVIHEEATPELVVICAGAVIANRAFLSVDPERFERVLRVNLIAPANVARAFAPTMQTGVIAVMASNPEGFPPRGLSAYAAGKAGVERLWQTLAEEHQGNPSFVAVFPGLVDTDMLRSSLGDAASFYPTADDWAKKASTALLAFGPEQNGQHLRFD